MAEKRMVDYKRIAMQELKQMRRVFDIQPNESWIPSLEGRYSVDTGGNVYTHKGKKKRMVGGKTGGYRVFTAVYSDGVVTNLYVHRKVAETFIPNPEDLKFVKHKDGDKLNNEVSNLFWSN